MCHPGDQEYMLMDKTWGIMPLSSMYPSAQGFYFFNFCDILTISYCSPKPSRSHTWIVELIGEDFHKNQAIQEVVG